MSNERTAWMRSLVRSTAEQCVQAANRFARVLSRPATLLGAVATRRGAARAGAVALIATLAFAMMAETADARRMGGSRSFGRQSPMVSQQAPRSAATTPSPTANATRPATPPAAPATPARNRWLGPLAGIAAGLGIAALLSHFGLGGALASMMANMLIIAAIAFVAFWLFRKFMGRRQPQPAYAGGDAGRTTGAFDMTNRSANADRAVPVQAQALSNDSAAASGSVGGAGTRQGWSDTPGSAAGLAGGVFGGAAAGSGAMASAAATAPEQGQWGVPADFDQATFLHNAKVYFVRMQASWDAADLDDIRSFTTPEMFAELRLDLQARGATENHTDVVRVDAELMGIEESAAEYIASVRFTGQIREQKGAPTEDFTEVWNLVKRRQGEEGWLLAGIQQLH